LQRLKATNQGSSILLDDTISDEELRARLFAAVPREELVACVDEIGEWVIGKRSDLFHGIIRRHGMLRKFSPALLEALELTQDIEGEQSWCCPPSPARNWTWRDKTVRLTSNPGWRSTCAARNCPTS
jgi:hypothetical protein